MTDVTIEINGSYAKTSGRKWTSSDEYTQNFLNVVASPDAVKRERTYVPDMALAMLELIEKIKPTIKVLKIENQPKQGELPKDAVL